MEHVVFNLVVELESAAAGREGLGSEAEAFALAPANIKVILEVAEQDQSEGEVLRIESAHSPKLEGLHVRQLWL